MRVLINEEKGIEINVYDNSETFIYPTEMPDGISEILRFNVESVTSEDFGEVFLLCYEYWYINRNSEFHYAGEFFMNHKRPFFGVSNKRFVSAWNIIFFYFDSIERVNNAILDYVIQNVGLRKEKVLII